jgi:hypothetical protein
MAFKIKDLMINIASTAGDIDCKGKSGCTATGPHPTPTVCGMVSVCHASTVCDAISVCRASTYTPTYTPCDFVSVCRASTRTICDANSACRASTIPTPAIPCTASTRGTEGEELLAELMALKSDLKEALATVDKRIEELEETMKPNTVAEIDELQTKLKEALAELDQRKKDLEK